MVHEDISHLINCIAITLFFILLGADDQSLASLQDAHTHRRLEGLKKWLRTLAVTLNHSWRSKTAAILCFLHNFQRLYNTHAEERDSDGDNHTSHLMSSVRLLLQRFPTPGRRTSTSTMGHLVPVPRVRQQSLENCFAFVRQKHPALQDLQPLEHFWKNKTL